MDDFLVWNDVHDGETFFVSRDDIEDMKVNRDRKVEILRRSNANAEAFWLTLATHPQDYPRFMSLDLVNDHIAELMQPTVYPKPEPPEMPPLRSMGDDVAALVMGKAKEINQRRLALERVLLTRFAKLHTDLCFKPPELIPLVLEEMSTWLENHPHETKALEEYK